MSRIFLVVMRIHGRQPERGGNAGDLINISYCAMKPLRYMERNPCQQYRGGSVQSSGLHLASR